MTASRRLFAKSLAKLFDLFALTLSMVIASLAVLPAPRGVTLTALLEMRIKLSNCLIFALLLLVWHNVFAFCGLYVSKRLTKQFTQVAEVMKATMLAAFVLFLFARICKW